MLLLTKTIQEFARYSVLMTASVNGDESAGWLLFSFRSIMTDDSWREGTGRHTRVQVVGWKGCLFIMREVYK